MYARYSDRADFRLVYIREAHPTDGWREASNDEDGVREEQPRSFMERVAVAGRFCSRMKTSIPVLVDSMNDNASELYAAFPERLYIIGKDGRVAYKGGRGPLGFDPHELEQSLLLVLLAEKGAGAR